MKPWLFNQLNQPTFGFYGIPCMEICSLYGTKIMNSKCHLFPSYCLTSPMSPVSASKDTSTLQPNSTIQGKKYNRTCLELAMSETDSISGIITDFSNRLETWLLIHIFKWLRTCRSPWILSPVVRVTLVTLKLIWVCLLPDSKVNHIFLESLFLTRHPPTPWEHLQFFPLLLLLYLSIAVPSATVKMLTLL